MVRLRWLQKAASVTLIFSMVLSLGTGTLAASPAEEQNVDPIVAERVSVEPITLATPTSGLRFNYAAKEYAEMAEKMTIPNTVEVWAKLDSGKTVRQIIFNSYWKGIDGESSWGLELSIDQKLRYWEANGADNKVSLFFDTPVCTEEWMLLSIVRDLEEQEVSLYVNGAFAETKAVDTTQFEMGKAGVLTYPMRFGNDKRNTYFLDGEIAEIRMWTDMRTAEEIAGNAGSIVEGTEEGLVHAWNFRDIEAVYSDSVFPDLVQSDGIAVNAVGYAENPDTEYTVTFDLTGGAAAAPLPQQTVKTGTLLTQPDQEITKTGFVFTGWYKDERCTEKWNFSTDTVRADGTLYAGWSYQYISAGFEGMTGVSFSDSDDQLAMAKKFSAAPLTFEATIKLPADLTGRGGIIAGNWMGYANKWYDMDLGYVGMEINENGAPRLYWEQGESNQPGNGKQSVVFPEIDLRRDEWVHLAITFDPNTDTVQCYVNGVLIATQKGCDFTPVIPAQALKIGGDYRKSGGTSADANYNSAYFRGEIANVSIWSTTRSGEAILADVNSLKASAAGVPAAEEGLLSSWSFAKTAEGMEATHFEDQSANGNDVDEFVDWIEPEFAKGDYSLAVLPDTQFLTQPGAYKNLTQWVVDHKDTYNIQAVMHMGDMVDQNVSAQWNAAQKAMDILDQGGIPWMPMRGNHDNSDGFNKTFPYQKFASRDYFVGSYEKDVLGQNKLDSNCWEITVGDRAYLILSLGWAPRQETLNWAKDIIEANPDKNVIVTAHGFMNWDGTHLAPPALGYPSSYPGEEESMDGIDIWEQLGDKYPNVVLGLSGHIGFPDIVTCTKPNGAEKDVATLLCDAQGMESALGYGLGMIMLMTFHEDSDTVDINWYSVKEGKLFRDQNQFSITVPHVTAATISGSVAITGDAVYGGTLTADISNLLPANASVSVQWKRGETVVSTENTYTLTKADIGSVITLMVTGTGDNTGTLSEQSAAVRKAAQPEPIGVGKLDETDIDANNGTITGVTTAMEYKLDSADRWTKILGTAVTNLAPGTYMVRFQETSTAAASASVTVVICAKAVTPVDSVSLDKTQMTLYSNSAPGSYRLAATVAPDEATNKDVTWSSDTPGVATVSDDGLVTAVSDGTAMITVTTESGGRTAACAVTVTTYEEPYVPSHTPPTGAATAEKNKDGSTTKTVTDKKSGEVTATTTYPDGSKIVVATPKDGETSIVITVPKNKDTVTVTIPTAQKPAPGEVAVMIHENGVREIIKSSVATEDGLRVTLAESGHLEIVDNSKTFADVPENHWAADSVKFAASRELFNGTDTDTFSPGLNMTRDMFLTVLYRYDGGGAAAPGQPWYSAAQTWAVKSALSDGTRMEEAITREQMATLLYRYAGRPQLPDGAASALDGFADRDAVSDNTAEAMKWAVSAGLLTGRNGNRLDPTGTATRAEVATMLERFVSNSING